ncbi:Aste57867_24479 [Aphanomyces stellatus]|uniref:Aste57867_24479 protein n=1 Tax=Aphanomyces stellatus TaxID=120398 RepID=A0A485LQJ5_9STRA|nr:hypothetical protein As57867_024402 [Aphanomyces stellatus]VFU01118.1 Aste57867_24479 [Aphanomyces stellatus]
MSRETALGVVGATVAMVVVGGAIALRMLFGPGDEDAMERVHKARMEDEIKLEATYRRESEFIPSTDGARVFTQTWYPTIAPKGIVVVLHGVNGHSGLCTAHFNVLLRDGFIAAALDFRGFGRSAGRHGYIASISDLADDTLAFVRRLRAQHPDQSIFLCGGSMGGLVAVHVILKAPSLFHGLVLQAPALHIHAAARPPWIVEAVARILYAIAPKLPILGAVDARPIDPNDAAQVALARVKQTDPLFYTGRMRLGTGLALLTATEAIAHRMHEVALPMLVQHGDCDIIVRVDGSRRFHAAAASTDKTLHVYSGGGHVLWVEPDAIAKPFFEDLTRWLQERV